MENNNRSNIVGTLRSANGVELVKKCVVCHATLIVATDETDKDRHTVCGWTEEHYLDVLARADAVIERQREVMR